MEGTESPLSTSKVGTIPVIAYKLQLRGTITVTMT